MRGDVESVESKKNIRYSEMIEQIVREALYGGGALSLNLQVKNKIRKPFNIVCGHRRGVRPDLPTTGPEQCDVMVIGKTLGRDEVTAKRCQVGPSAKYMLESLRKAGAENNEIGRWYMTNVLKTPHLEGDRGALKQTWIKSQLHLLHQELALVRPKYILCLGADAVKVVLGKAMTLAKVDGRVVDFEYTSYDPETQAVSKNSALVIGCLHPAAVMSDPDLQGKFQRTITRFLELTRGDRWDQKDIAKVDHRVIRDELQLLSLCDEMERDCAQEGFGKIVALDAEWHGAHPQNHGAYLRTIQVSWAHGKAAIIPLRHSGGDPAFKRIVKKKTNDGIKRVLSKKGGVKRAIEILGRFLKGKRVCGFQLASDMEWFLYEGLDVREEFSAPLDWRDCRMKGGLDAVLMAHAADEVDDFTLTGQLLRYTDIHRYDVELKNELQAVAKAKGCSTKDLEGFGDIKDETLFPYGCYDADGTRRLVINHIPRLDCDVFGNNCWEAYWISARAAIPIIEMNTTGILVDEDRMATLTMLFSQKKAQLAQQIRDWANWPEINLESRFMVAELLFGEHYNGHPRNPDGSFRVRRPPGARVIGTQPLLTTGKRPRPWEEIAGSKDEQDYTAAANKQVLGMLWYMSKNLRVMRNGEFVVGDYSEIIGAIRNYRFISHVIKTVLRPPATDSSGEYIENEYGEVVYERGLAKSICSDKRIRTFITQLLETGRWASARPNLQNLGKRRESDYATILGKDYLYPIRSILKADPGYVLLEADYKGAELYGMAIMSGDPDMLRDAQRNLLPEWDPNYYDIHSNIAKLAFRLDCEPTKAGLQSIGKKDLRNVAKAVIFGVAYGRQAKAIAVAAKEEGVHITETEAQAVINAIFSTYPGLVPFFADCRARVSGVRDEHDNLTAPPPRFMCGALGRFRRFPIISDRDNYRKMISEQERQAQNLPLQNMVADLVARAVDKLYMYRMEQSDIDFKMVLQIHDALLFLVRYEDVPRMVDEVIPFCMTHDNPVFRCDLDGMPISEEPYYLGVDTEPYLYWGVTMHPHQCEQAGFSPKYAGWRESKIVDGGWEHPDKYSRKVWLPTDNKLHDVKEFAVGV